MKMIEDVGLVAAAEVSSIGRRLHHDWWRDFGLFALAIIFPSIAIFRKVGWAPLVGYLLCATAGLYLLLRHILPVVGPRLSARLCSGLVICFFGLLTVALYWIYPQILEHHGFRLLGIQFGVSDSNDAFVVTWKAMMAGKYPYYEKSFLGNPISPMPGSLFIVLPFYLLGSTALQNVVWLLVFWLALGKYYRDFRMASIMVLTVAGLCPDLVYTVVQGGDYMTNSIYVLLAGLFLIVSVERRHSPRWTFGAAAALGLALSSRANYLLLVPIIFFALVRLGGFSCAVKHLVVTVAVLGLVTLPFFLYDPGHFSPLHTTNKLDLGGRLPHAAELIFCTGCLLATILGLLPGRFVSLESVCARMFFVQEFAVLSGFAVAWFALRHLDLSYPHFALLSMFFGVVAFGPGLFRRALSEQEVTEETERGRP